METLDLFGQTVPSRNNPIILDLKNRMTDGVGEGWTQLFQNLDTQLYDSLRGVVDTMFTDRKRVHPTSSIAMRAFRECKMSIVKVVFIGQDPYHQPGVADGLAFSCSRTKVEQPSLRLILDEVTRTTGSTNRDPDLTRWANQGVLMLNTALTVQEYKAGSHAEIWSPFTHKFIQELTKAVPGLIYVMFGRKAQEYSRLIPADNTKIEIVHPAAAAHRGGNWDCNDVFNNINSVLIQQRKETIIW